MPSKTAMSLNSAYHNVITDYTLLLCAACKFLLNDLSLVTKPHAGGNTGHWTPFLLHSHTHLQSFCAILCRL
jgi:hypothetical protein